MSETSSCVVIGAGPGGLVTTKELLENGFDDVLCLEKTGKIGGVFSDTYDNLLLTSSVTFSMFSDYWVGDNRDNDFWTKEEAVQYWTDYAKHYKVLDQVRFNTSVKNIEKSSDGNWIIHTDNGGTINTKRLVLAVGNNRIPRLPDWHQQLTNIKYLHSQEYLNASEFKDKNVLIVGGGESASDIAHDISKVAKQTWLSLRESTGWVIPRKRGEHAADVSTHRGIWDLPRDYGTWLSKYVLKLERGRNDPVFDALADLNDRVKARFGIWGVYGTKTLGLPIAIAKYGCKVVEEITKIEDGGKKLTTAHNQMLEEVDAVIFCTGYTNSIDFMPEDLRGPDPRSLFKHMFHLEHGDNVAWIGWARPNFGSQFPIMELQARYCGLVFSGKQLLPHTSTMQDIIAEDLRRANYQFEGMAERTRSLVDYHGFMNRLAKLIGCQPPIYRYFFLHPIMWLHIMYGPTQATQFRLHGPGNKFKLAREILLKLPVSTFNHIVKAGLRGRLVFLFKKATHKTKA